MEGIVGRDEAQELPVFAIDRGLEVAEFIAERTGRMILRDIVDDCRRTFGPDRTPSLSATHRFLQRLIEP